MEELLWIGIKFQWDLHTWIIEFSVSKKLEYSENDVVWKTVKSTGDFIADENRCFKMPVKSYKLFQEMWKYERIPKLLF